MARPLLENAGSGRGEVVVYKTSTVSPVLLTLPLPRNLPLLPPSITCTFLTRIHFRTSNGEERLEEEGRADGKGMEEIPEHRKVPW